MNGPEDRSGRPPLPDLDADAALTEMRQMAALNTEVFNAHVEAGMPPMAVAVMLGVMMATSGSLGQHGTDGT